MTGNSGYMGGTTIASGTLGFGSRTALGTGNVSDFNAGSSSNFLIAEFDGGMFTIALGDMVGGSATQIYVVYTAVPEPGTLTLAGIGLAAAAGAARRRRHGQRATSRHMSVASSRR